MSLTQINKAGLDEIALDHVFTIGASGSSAYTFQGEGLTGTVNNPTLYLTRGKTYRFENGSGGHPIRIQSTSGASGTAYNTGVTNNAGSGTVIVEVQHDAPDVLYYQCTSHPAMNGILYITGALADGGVTTAKIADDAVNNDKLANSVVASIAANTAKTTNATHTGDVTGSTSLTIANGAVTEAKLATNAVTTDKINSGVVTNAKLAANAVGTANIADEAVTLAKLPHGTSSNDGKFLRANNGADPSFETVSIPAGTTINSNSDNRVITGSGTANTLNAESTFTHDPSTTDTTIQHNTNTVADLIIQNDGSGTAAGARLTLQSGSNANTGPQLDLRVGSDSWTLQTPKNAGALDFNDNGTLAFKMASNGNFDVITGDVTINGSGKGIDFAQGANTGTAANILHDYEEGTFTPAVVNGWGILGGSGGSTGLASVEEGKYVKVGDIVHLYFSFKDGGSGGSFNGNTLLFYGLPFVPESDSQWPNSGQKSQILNAFSDVNSSGGGSGLFCAVAQYGSVSLAMRRRVSGGTSAYTGTNIGSGGQIWVTGTYRAA